MSDTHLFDSGAEGYDRERYKLVPDFDGLYGTVLRVIPFSPDEAVQVLDLGAGTGLLSALIAQAYPRAQLHLTDISEAMLREARQRFASEARVRVSLQAHDQLAELDAYDLVLSALSIHHLVDAEKRDLFAKVVLALRPGGLFINLDQALGPTPALEQAYERQWLRDVRVNQVSEDALNAARKRMLEDKSAPLDHQLRWLEEAGFVDVDCWYKRFRFVVLGGRKPSP